MTQDQTIVCHCSSSLKRDIHDIAEARDQSISEFIRETMTREVHELKKEEVVREARAEERIEETVALAKDEIRQEVKEFKETAQQVQEVTAKTGVYAIANWEVIKQDHPDNLRQDALSKGSRRLRDDLIDDLDLDLDLDEIDPETSSNKPWE